MILMLQRAAANLSEAIPSLEIQGYFDFEGIWDAELTPASNDQNQAIA